MSISAISQQQFDALGGLDSCRSQWSRDSETDWYADSSGKLIGVILFDGVNDCWSFIFCERVSRDKFTRRGVGTNFKHVTHAEKDLVTAMERHLAKLQRG